MKKITANGVNWLNIKKATERDLEQLKEKFRLHPFVVRQFLPPIHRPKIEEYPGQLFIVLHLPVFNKKERQTRPVELDIIVTPDTLITSYNETIPALETFFNDCQLQEYHKNQYFKSNGYLLFGLLDWLIDSSLPMLDHIAENINQIEEHIFKGQEKEVVSEIAVVKKDLIDFRRAVKPQRSVLEVLEKKCHSFFGLTTKPLAQETVGSSMRVWNVLENHWELINSLEQTNNSLLSNKLGDIMKVLTVLSFIILPLGLIINFFSMNIFGSVPLINHPLSWALILILIFLIALVMFLIFKIKKWL